VRRTSPADTGAREWNAKPPSYSRRRRRPTDRPIDRPIDQAPGRSLPTVWFPVVERRTLQAVIYEREPPIARIVLNRVAKANTKDATLVEEVDACLHEADRDPEIKVVILKANGNGFCGGHVARWGPDENPYPTFGDSFESLYKGTADLFLWPTLYLWEFPKITISQIHGYCLGGGIYLGLLTDFCVAADDAYFQMPLAQSLGEPGGHTMIEPWLLMNWHRTMDWLLLAPTIDAKQALDWGLLNKVVARDDLESTVEEMAAKIAQIPLTTLMAVKNNVKRAWELMGMRVHLQVSHILTNLVGAAGDVQARRAELIESNLKPRAFIEQTEATGE
jgi:enoyl-CoA hydratase/carnithine racemase